MISHVFQNRRWSKLPVSSQMTHETYDNMIILSINSNTDNICLYDQAMSSELQCLTYGHDYLWSLNI